MWEELRCLSMNFYITTAVPPSEESSKNMLLSCINSKLPFLVIQISPLGKGRMFFILKCEMGHIWNLKGINPADFTASEKASKV